MTLNEGVNLIEGRSAFCLAVRCELALLATVETLPVTRELTWVDEDFSEWPLDGGQLQVHLEAFLRRPGRRLRMIAHRFGPIAQRHPRFAAWRKNWSHALDAWEFPEPGVLGSVLVSSATIVELHDKERALGRVGRGPGLVRAALERVADWQARCQPGWPATTLGL